MALQFSVLRCAAVKTAPALASTALSALALAGGLGLAGACFAQTAGPTAGQNRPTVSAAEDAWRAIDKEVIVPAGLEAVWAAWTTADGITSFFAPEAVVEARPGGAFDIHMNPLAAPGQKGADGMRFMMLQPMRQLSFEWNAPPHLPQARAQRTLVMLAFEPISATSTRVRLHHVGWGSGGEWDLAFAYFDQAWGNVLKALVNRFQTGQRRDWTAWMEQLRVYQRAAEAAAAASAAK